VAEADFSLRAALVGCGPRGLEHARAIGDVEGLELVAVADVSELARQEAGESLGVGAFADLDSLLGEVSPEIVSVVTPPEVREPLVERAATADGVRGIVVEKPLALNMAEAERMVSVCDREGVLLVVGHQLRFVPQFVALKEAVDEGAIGRLELVRAAGYGDLLDQGPHLVDAIRWLAGGARILWAMSQRGDRALDRLPRDPETQQDVPPWTVHYLSLEGGGRAMLETGPLHQRGRDFVDDYLDKRVTLVGSDGVAHCSAAGGSQVLRAGRAPEERPGGIEDYLSATTSLYVELREALGGRASHRTEAHDALASLEGVLACAQSIVDGDAAVLPLDRGRDVIAEIGGSAGAGARTRPAPEEAGPAETGGIGAERGGDAELSVILPLPDHRGHAAASVRSWVMEQTVDDWRCEVVVLSDGSDPALEEEIQALLRDGDRLIRDDGAHEIELYDLGARAARGRLLLFTEPHCVAEPQCVEELLDFMQHTDFDGACCRTVAASSNAVARMEQRVYDDGFREWSRPGNWCKVILRGFLIYRQVYLDEGGFPTRYQRFAEFLLAAQLHAGGRRLGYASGAAVTHHNTTSLKDLVPPIEDFARGEFAFRLEHPDGRFDRYFGAPPQWTGRRELDRNAARAALALALRSLGSRQTWRTGKAREMLRTLARFAGPALFGARWRLLGAHISYWFSRARCRLWRLSDDRLERAYRDAWDRLVAKTRLKFLAELEQGPAALASTERFRLHDLPEDRLFGFHPPEEAEGIDFRWSGPVAFADLPVDPGSYQVGIDTNGLQAPTDDVQVFFNGRRCTTGSDNGRLTFSVDRPQFDREGEQRLALTCAAIRLPSSSPDQRKLGLPVAEIEFRPLVD
jgi:predicted dehydrogenase